MNESWHQGIKYCPALSRAMDRKVTVPPIRMATGNDLEISLRYNVQLFIELFSSLGTQKNRQKLKHIHPSRPDDTFPV